GSRVLKRQRIPYVVSPHGSLMPLPLRQKSLKKKIVLELWERANLEGAGALIAASEPEANALRELGFHTEIRIIPYALAPSASAYFRSHDDAPIRKARDEPRTLLSVGRYHPSKRLLELVEIFA